MKRLDLVATITDDFTLNFDIPRLLTAELAQIGAGSKVRVDVKRWYKKRSNQQNRTIWGVDYPIILQFMSDNGEPGYNAEELHDFHKRMLIGFEKSEKFPGMYKIKSSTELDTKEFADKFREEYCRFWAEKGCYIPDPVRQEED